MPDCRTLIRGLPSRRLFLGILAGSALAPSGCGFTGSADPVRLRTWDESRSTLESIEREMEKAVEPTIRPVALFFQTRQAGARAFAADVLSVEGKLAYVKGFYDPASHDHFLETSFAKHLFNPAELKSVIEAAVDGYVAEMQKREDELLSSIQHRLNQAAVDHPERIPRPGDLPEFRAQYQAVIAEVMPAITRDMGITVATEFASELGGDVARQVLTQIAATMTARLGVSGGIVGAGASTSVATFGVGLVAGILVDMALEWVLRQIGYDPEGAIAQRVEATFGRLTSLVLEGELVDPPHYDDPGKLAEAEGSLVRQPNGTKLWVRPERIEHFNDLRVQINTEKAARLKADQKRLGNGPGLRYQLLRLNQLRARLREAAIRQLILEGPKSNHPATANASAQAGS